MSPLSQFLPIFLGHLSDEELSFNVIRSDGDHHERDDVEGLQTEFIPHKQE
jgi:hypothetical protein